MNIYRSVSKKLSIETWIIGNWKNKRSLALVTSRIPVQFTIHDSRFTKSKPMHVRAPDIFVKLKVQPNLSPLAATASAISAKFLIPKTGEIRISFARFSR